MSVPVGVVGVGNMGRHHARVYHELTDARLVGVADADPDTAASVADAYDTAAVPMDALIDRAEAVSVAVPSRYHRQVGVAALEAGLDVLVEKPIAPTVSEARELVAAAEANDAVLQVGHVERFNPAISTVSEFVGDLDLLAVEARRLGPPVGEDRSVDSDVVLDLMIHDLDVVRALVGDEVTGINAVGHPTQGYVSAGLQFDDGTVGSLTASRVTQRKVRKLTLTATDCLVTVDYMDRSVSIDRRNRPSYLDADGDLRYRSERVVERPTVDNGEPLKKELAAFLDAVRNGSEPVVTGADGVAALALATRISDACEAEPQAAQSVVQD